MRDFQCPLRGDEKQVEYLVVPAWDRDGGSYPDNVKGEVPRACAEAIGVNCSPLDKRDSWGRQGTVWFTAEQSQRLRAHRHYVNRRVP